MTTVQSETALIEMRNEEAGFTEWVNEDVPTITRELTWSAAVLLDMNTRKVVGYRVYDASPPPPATDALAETLVAAYAELEARQTPTDPDIAEIVAANRTALYMSPVPATEELVEPEAMTLLRGPLSQRATSAEFTEWSARDVVAYVNKLNAALQSQAAALAEARRDIGEASTYLRNLLRSFVTKYCGPVPEWQPLPDLIGMLTQIDNATTVTADWKSRADSAEAKLKVAEEALRRIGTYDRQALDALATIGGDRG
jgi:predicted S18 family serine protease